MAPSETILKRGALEGRLFRRLAVSPDYSITEGGVVLATWDAPSVPILAVTMRGDDALHSLSYNRSSPWVELPYPPMDVAWCPFKKGNDSASFLTACRSCPLQLWDVEDAALRASYCCSNTVGMPAHPHAISWSNHRSFLTAGYGGTDDDVHLRFYDVLYEGNTVQSSYRSQCSKGSVSAISDGPTPYRESLVLAGFLRSGNVDVVDTRHCGVAAVLRGLRSGAMQIGLHPTAEYMVYAAGRIGDNRILCWDIRKSNTLLASFPRELRTQQPTFFGFVQREAGGRRQVDLVSATHNGGVLLFQGCVSTGEPQHVGAELGLTAGLAVLGAGSTVAVTVGERCYAVQDRYEANMKVSETTVRCAKRSRTSLDDAELESVESSEMAGNVGYISVLDV